MNQPRYRLRNACCLAVMCVAGFAAHAAGISASASKNYGRVNFDFSSPAKLKASSTGTTAVLSFDQPIEGSPEGIKAALPDYVTGASLSADKRSLTLTLTKPYRVRQFVTGNGVGIDLIAAPEKPLSAKNDSPARPAPEDLSAPASVTPEAEEQAASNPPAEPAENSLAALPAPPTVIATKKAVVEKKPEVKTLAATPKPATPPKPKPIVPAKPVAEKPKVSEAELLSTKKQLPTSDIKPAAKEPPAAPAPESVLTTKASEPRQYRWVSLRY